MPKMTMLSAIAFATAPTFLPRPIRHVSSEHCVRLVSTPRRRVSVATAAPVPRDTATVKVGDIVAAELGSTAVTIARVTGVASSGDTVDIVPLEEFVRELYVQGKEDATYARAEAVRPVRAEYVPSQQGWIVLNQDLETARNYFQARKVSGGGERIVVAPEPPRELPPEALERQYFPKPTRSQALFGAALSLPVAALFYSGFAAARNAYQANPAGEDFLSGEVFRKIVLFTTYSASAATVLLGCYLVFYALTGADE